MSGGVERFDVTVDFLVAGSGAGGLTAALAANARGLRTLVVEKAAKFGGTSALSGGGSWVPGAPAQRREGYAMQAAHCHLIDCILWASAKVQRS